CQSCFPLDTGNMASGNGRRPQDATVQALCPQIRSCRLLARKGVAGHVPSGWRDRFQVRLREFTGPGDSGTALCRKYIRTSEIRATAITISPSQLKCLSAPLWPWTMTAPAIAAEM